MAVKLALLAGIEQGHGIEGFQGHFEANAVPLLLDDLRTLTVVGQVGITDHLDGSAHGTCLLEQDFGLVRIVLQAAAALQVPGVASVGRAGRAYRPGRKTPTDGWHCGR